MPLPPPADAAWTSAPRFVLPSPTAADRQRWRRSWSGSLVGQGVGWVLLLWLAGQPSGEHTPRYPSPTLHWQMTELVLRQPVPHPLPSPVQPPHLLPRPRPAPEAARLTARRTVVAPAPALAVPAASTLPATPPAAIPPAALPQVALLHPPPVAPPRRVAVGSFGDREGLRGLQTTASPGTVAARGRPGSPGSRWGSSPSPPGAWGRRRETCR